MKKQYVVAILLFSGIWGISETIVGGALYKANIPYASIPLTVIAFITLTFAQVHLPQKGTATLIAALAMLYKFMNAPFFACHFLGILLTGIYFDVFFSVFKLKNKSLSAAGAAYLSYITFALMITYLFRYEYWAQAGLPKVINYIAVGGTAAALACAVAVPLSLRLAQKIKASSQYGMPLNLKLRIAARAIPVASALIWIFGVAVFFSKI